MRKGNAAESAFTARVMAAAQFLKSNGYADVAAFLAKQELSARKPTRRAKRKVSVRSSTGKAARGGAFWIDGESLKD